MRAAYDTLEVSLWDLLRDHRREMEDLIAQMSKEDAEELEEQVYKKIVLDLCFDCQRKFIQSPLSFRKNEAGNAPPTDIDVFLRSLGFGESSGE